jgi:60 kDa SS-A/Ro ribonucleoprotein
MSAINRVQRNLRVTTHEGASVPAISAEKQLNRIVLASMLFENEFYVDGISNAHRIAELVPKVSAEAVAALALKARTTMKLRHVPLHLLRELARIGKLKASDLTNTIQRPDELGEFVAMYWKDKKQPLSNQVKKGLAEAFHKFNEYALAKWDKNSAAVRLRDVLFLTHAKPKNPEQEALFKRIASDTLETPDTWETELSSGANKCETFARLMLEKKLGALAFLRNLRNMVQAGVDESLIRSYAKSVNTDRVLPFRFLAAARIVPQFEDMLEEMMLRSLESHEKLPGKTVLLIDVSGSMFGAKVSAKSDLDRFDAAAALAILAREICEEVEIYSFSNEVVRVAPRRGFGLIEAIRSSQSHAGTSTGAAVKSINANTEYDRLVMFTDEATSDPVPNPQGKGYVINVASYENGINSGAWTTITGMSEAVIDYIAQSEKSVI